MAIVIGAACLAVAVSAWLFRNTLHDPLEVPASGYLLDVPTGSTVAAVAQQLHAEGVIEYPWVFSGYARLTGLDGSIKAGEYELAKGTTLQSLMRLLTEGRVRLHSLTIVEGWTFRDVMRALRKHSAIKQTLPVKDHASIIRAVELSTDHVEGWFFPDTYRFPRGTTDREVLTMAHLRMKALLDQAWAGRADNLPLRSPYEALILASIVEKETSLDRERPRIAGVFIRRLKTGMRLQTDPTVIYGLGEDFDGDITRRQLLRDTPYNTYTRAGLPPSPIALPGESSLLAAVHPDDSDALYFVASGDEDGSHVFSATLRDHNAAVRRYLAALRQAER